MAERKPLPTNQGGIFSRQDAVFTELNKVFADSVTIPKIDYAAPATQETQDTSVAMAAAQVARQTLQGTGNKRRRKGAAATLVTDGLGVTEPFNPIGKKTLLGE